jgi:hypothetical protein
MRSCPGTFVPAVARHRHWPRLPFVWRTVWITLPQHTAFVCSTRSFAATDTTYALGWCRVVDEVGGRAVAVDLLPSSGLVGAGGAQEQGGLGGLQLASEQDELDRLEAEVRLRRGWVRRLWLDALFCV